MRRDSASAANGLLPTIHRHYVWGLVLTYGIGAVLLLLPLAFTIEGFAVANNYAGNPDPTAQSQASEAMYQQFSQALLQ